MSEHVRVTQLPLQAAILQSVPSWVTQMVLQAVTPFAEAPDTPTVTVDQITETTARLTGSAYSHGEATPHAATQGRVLSASGDVLFLSPILGSVEEVEASGLSYSTSGLRGQMRYRDQDGNWSGWGESDPFATLALTLDGLVLRLSTLDELDPAAGLLLSGTAQANGDVLLLSGDTG